MHAAGWYADPHSPSLERWFDGQRWTEHARGRAPIPPPIPPPQSQPLPQPPAQFQAPPPQPPVQHPQAHQAFVPPSVVAQQNGVAHQNGVALQPQNGQLQQQVVAMEQRLATLRRELESVEEAVEIQSFGFYRPKYDFKSATQYADKTTQIREQQKRLIKAGGATFCHTTWSVGGSAAEGKKMIERMSKLMLRAFNGECDAAIAKVRYDNVDKLEQRITKSCEEVNKLGHSNQVEITRPYYELKLAELHVVHEHREKVQEEKEEQKRIREEMREEEKARDEIERAKASAEKDEATKQKALEKAKADLEGSAENAKQTEKLAALVARLETELKSAIEVKAKAIARAQLTKSGHVYVLSNIGSFGEGVYKIGLTRRLDPYERVDELGDASVPFCFDVHAIIYAEDAPALENALHKEFAAKRLNRVNARKEYFRVSLDEIKTAVEKHHGLVTMVLEAEAEEWRKTHALLGEGGQVAISPL